MKRGDRPTNFSELGLNYVRLDLSSADLFNTPVAICGMRSGTV